MKRPLHIQLVLALAAACLLTFPASGFAQDKSTADAPAETEKKAEDTPAEADTKSDEISDETDDKETGEARVSKDGDSEWKRSFGGGLEVGFWFNGLDRWNSNLLQPVEDATPEPTFDIAGHLHIDAAFEASLLEKTRLTIFGGVQSPFSSNPSALAYYLGIEPAFAFRTGGWELAIGMGFGIGAVSLDLDSGAGMEAGLVVLRPFLELRRYLNESFALYARAGFNQWLVDSPDLTDLEFTRNDDGIDDDNLNEGGAYVALGFRFGSYPEHIKSVPDTDGDGIKDDIDDCPEDPEDFDEFEDGDGCPELDNDGDGINDKEDRCPMEPEDKDGWMDEDGCPETDDDADGDGLLNAVDKCPNDAEDKDGFQDEDGCPELDNDNDGILDAKDKCPLKPGVPQKEGCPFERVEITLDSIIIKDKIFFAYNKADIKSESNGLLNDVAATIVAFPRIKKIEVGGHTDHKGSEKYNTELSSKRAAAVVDYLVAKGVEAERLTSKGYGFSKPLVAKPADGKETPEAAEQNRRVEFVITEQEEVKKTVREDEVPEGAKVGPNTEGAKPADAKPADAKPADAAKPETK